MSKPICIPPRLVRPPLPSSPLSSIVEYDDYDTEEDEEFLSPQPYGTCGACPNTCMPSILYKNGGFCEECIDKMYPHEGKSESSMEYEKYIESIFPEPNGTCGKCRLIFPNKDLYKNGGFCEKCLTKMF